MHETGSNMAYAIVHFIQRDEVGIVPCTWIHNNKCKWPNLPSHIVDKKVKKAAPPGDNCQEMEIQVKGLFMSWNDARRMLPRAEYQSDLNDGALPPKRMRRARVIDSDDEDEDVFPLVPENIMAKAKPRAVCSTSNLPLHDGKSKHSVRQVARPSTFKPLLCHQRANDTHKVGQSHSWCGSTEPVTHEPRAQVVSSQQTMCIEETSSSMTELALEQVDVSPETSRASCRLDEGLYIRTATAQDAAVEGAAGASCWQATRARHQPMPDYEFQHQVLKHLNILRLAIQQQGEVLSSLAPLQTSLIEVPKLLERPLNTVEELEAFEKQLTPEREKQLVLELSLLGGNATKVAVRRIMAYVVTNDLGQQYSWEGKKGKLPFRDLALQNLILRTVHTHKKLAKATRFEVEQEIKEWLRHARERAQRAKAEDS